MKNTKAKLISSVAVLLICFAMLIGSTFAWFTDSASTGVNKIQAGNLDVKLLTYRGTQDGYVDVEDGPNNPLSLFGASSSNVAQNNNMDTLWEPGKTQVAYLRIENKGNLALKYKVEVQAVNPSDGNNLYQALSYSIVPNATPGENGNPGFTWSEISGNKQSVNIGANTAALDVPMQPNDTHNFALAVHMNEEAGNEYKNGKVEFYIKVLATQLSSENDSFGNGYDADALYPSIAMGTVVSGENTVLSSEGISAVIPAGALDNGRKVTIEATKTTPPADLSLPEGLNAIAYEITLKDADGNLLTTNPNKPVEVTLKVGAGLSGVRFYHNNEEIYDFTYNEATGELEFKTSTFSPFTVATGTAIYHVNPSTIQDYLDGKYGSVSNAELILAAGNYGKIDLARATKYPASNTDYYIGGVSEENKKTFDEFYAIKNSGSWSASAYYVRNIENLTLNAEEGADVTIDGLVASSGHYYGEVYDYVLDKAYTIGSAYYLSHNLKNISFENLHFTSKVEFATSSADTVIDGVNFTNCSFTTGGTSSSNGQALRYYNEANNGKVKNLTVDDCSFNNCYQGVYTQKINGVTVKNSSFDITGHNAIAVQSGGAVNHKTVIITGNTFANVGDRIIRFGDVGADTQITIKNNTATNSGDSSGEVIKAQSLATGITYDISDNNWGEGKTVANPEFADINS